MVVDFEVTKPDSSSAAPLHWRRLMAARGREWTGDGLARAVLSMKRSHIDVRLANGGGERDVNARVRWMFEIIKLPTKNFRKLEILVQ